MAHDAAVAVEVAERIATLTIDRPAKLNALNYRVVAQIMEALDRVDDDARIGAVIITGRGDRAFSAGADIGEFAQSIARGGDAALREFVIPGQRMTHRIQYFAKPVIAAVNG